MVVSVLFCIDQNGHIEVVDSGPAPAVTVDTDGQLHAETGINTHTGEDQDGELWRWLSKDTRPARFRRNLPVVGGSPISRAATRPRTSGSPARRPRWFADLAAAAGPVTGRRPGGSSGREPAATYRRQRQRRAVGCLC